MPESQKKDPAIADLLSSGLFNTTHIDEQIRKEQEEREKFTEALKKAHEEGEDISDYVWPREWDFRKRPKPHHASNIKQFSNDWIKALAECLCQKRRGEAPIDEPCEHWIQNLRKHLS